MLCCSFVGAAFIFLPNGYVVYIRCSQCGAEEVCETGKVCPNLEKQASQTINGGIERGFTFSPGQTEFNEGSRSSSGVVVNAALARLLGLLRAQAAANRRTDAGLLYPTVVARSPDRLGRRKQNNPAGGKAVLHWLGVDTFFVEAKRLGARIVFTAIDIDTAIPGHWAMLFTLVDFLDDQSTVHGANVNEHRDGLPNDTALINADNWAVFTRDVKEGDTIYKKGDVIPGRKRVDKHDGTTEAQRKVIQRGRQSVGSAVHFATKHDFVLNAEELALVIEMQKESGHDTNEGGSAHKYSARRNSPATMKKWADAVVRINAGRDPKATTGRRMFVNWADVVHQADNLRQSAHKRQERKRRLAADTLAAFGRPEAEEESSGASDDELPIEPIHAAGGASSSSSAAAYPFFSQGVEIVTDEEIDRARDSDAMIRAIFQAEKIEAMLPEAMSKLSLAADPHVGRIRGREVPSGSQLSSTLSGSERGGLQLMQQIFPEATGLIMAVNLVHENNKWDHPQAKQRVDDSFSAQPLRAFAHPPSSGVPNVFAAASPAATSAASASSAAFPASSPEY